MTSSTRCFTRCGRAHIAPAAYYSVIFDNWAVESHPEWALVPATTLNGQNRAGARPSLWHRLFEPP